ncbi:MULTISPECIES: hypothetical protein [unclassified Streptomyces]|uniref:hypothetical protein n=1 Tax=unclassified Streptomyces TaxID=2593676 RepID=UPI00225687A4|nr:MULTISPECIES: hypothetical protein [unclassified Streptomyces]MCX5162483.1 hypothetical protein [Streptomyces sp. NBC_00305]MCX5221000.1 hypothetical protein [Streptomyces sp. NBC_00264]MCX5502710.1 hypothetical protein [Streptomyces sp. NBC_00052]MCX5548754.1 hypothetical protein [Streptomyces sp. NBC_00051]WSP47037.1 hypothetical protein OG348_14760 [Streptomyces sp. NBC_01243]
MNRRQVGIGVATALAAMTVGIAAPAATAAQSQRAQSSPVSFQAGVDEIDVNSHATFVNYLDSAEGQAMLADADLTPEERSALYSDDVTTEAVVQGRFSALVKAVKKVKGCVTAVKKGFTAFKVWYSDKVPKAIRWAIAWASDVYTIYAYIKGHI